MTTERRNYELTKYHEIFKGTYWGRFPLGATGKQYLGENRNKLVETYKLKKLTTKRFPEQYYQQAIIKNEIGRDLRDHVEHYKTDNDDMVAVFSMHVDEKLKLVIEANGYIKFDPLYMLGQDSYVKLIVNEMPRITTKVKEETIIMFAKDAIKIIDEYLDLNSKEIERKDFKKDEWYYHVYKSYIDKELLEIRVKRMNYELNSDIPKKDRIYENAWIYKENENKTYKPCKGETKRNAKDLGYKINGYSVQDYERARCQKYK